jgi:hypothetical protein
MALLGVAASRGAPASVVRSRRRLATLHFGSASKGFVEPLLHLFGARRNTDLPACATHGLAMTSCLRVAGRPRVRRPTTCAGHRSDRGDSEGRRNRHLQPEPALFTPMKGDGGPKSVLFVRRRRARRPPNDVAKLVVTSPCEAPWEGGARRRRAAHAANTACGDVSDVHRALDGLWRPDRRG